MKWYFKQLGDHVHIRIFMNGALCGKIVLRTEEFNSFRRREVNIELLDDNLDKAIDI
jgi:hypothetical protein